MSATCPHCGQRMLARHGVQLPPLLADIFDMIERSGRRGIPIETLAWVFYSGKSKMEAHRCVAVNVNRLNDFLSPTNFEIRAPGKSLPYRVVERG